MMNENFQFEIDKNFAYKGYEVVHSEYFANINEPCITFNNMKFYANSVCVNKLSGVNYVQILVNPETHKLVIRPSKEDEKDSFLWCNINNKNGKNKPRKITCRIFFAKLMELMQWNSEHRYRILGKLIKSEDEYLFVFDLDCAEIYRRIYAEDRKPKSSRQPTFPLEWRNQFGLPVEEHRQKSLAVNIFEGYSVFSILAEDKNKNGNEGF